MFNRRISEAASIKKLSCVENHQPSVNSAISCKASRVISFPTGRARPWTYGTNTIITLPIQRDCPAPIPSALIGQTAGNQDRKHTGITQEASGAASQSRWITRCQRLQACNSAFFLKNVHFWSGTTRYRGRVQPHRVRPAPTLRLLRSL